MARNWFNRPLPVKIPPRAVFDLHEDRLQTMRLSRLCPIGVQECLPADVHMFSHDSFLRLAPLKYPILQKLNLNMVSFFVPDRLVIGEDKASELFSSLEPSDKKIPRLEILFDTTDDRDSFCGANSLLDYFGVQVEPSTSTLQDVLILNPVPIFQYLLIVRDYYLDENLEADKIAKIDAILDAYMETPLGGTLSISAQDDIYADFVELCVPFHVSKYRDYFTSGLPSPQRGDDVYIMNPVISTLKSSTGNNNVSLASTSSTVVTPGSLWALDSDGNPAEIGFETTVRDLLTKMAYQRFKNTLNQYGTRYNEFLAGNFGIINQDVRLQRAECIGRSRGVFQISEVIQQSASESDSPLGSYAGRGIGAKRTRNFRYKVNEHGYLFHLVSVVPDQGYMSGAPRWFFKQSGLDFALPQFNNIGEQAIYKGELFLELDSAQQAVDDNLEDFAYIPRYSEYRSGRNYASAGMRESPFTAWHLYEQYDQTVALNSEFIRANDSDRIFNLVDPTSSQNIVGVFHSYHAAFRPISYNPK